MNLAEIRKRLRNGFRPFTLTLSSGERIKVPRPGSIAVGKDIVVVLNERGTFRRIDRLDIATSVEDLRPKRRK